MSKKRKPKQKTIAWYKKALWKIFTRVIKHRDGWQCFTCDKYATGWGMNGGHFVSAGVCPPSLYFDEDNVHAQCADCNLKLEGNHYIYGIRLGKKRAERLLQMRHDLRGEKWTIEDYKEKIEYYKEKLKEYEDK